MTHRRIRLNCVVPLLAALAAAASGANSRGHSVNTLNATRRRINKPLTLHAAHWGSNTASYTAGDHIRVETARGPLHLWIPLGYDPKSAGMVIFIHGYFATVDQAWTDDHLAEQFQASGRNALFVAIEAPASNFQEVVWKSLDELLRTVDDSSPFPLPHGPLVIVGHSGAFRTILLWLRDPRVHYVTLLDGLYSGLGEFRYWLHTRYTTTPPRMVLVASDTWRQSSQLARRIYGTARRRGIPATASSFTPRETHARLLYLVSQYNHEEMISGGKVIPVLLEISPLMAVPEAKEEAQRGNP